MQQLCEAGEAEFLEIMDLVGMASKPMHVRRLQKALQEWVQNPGKKIFPLFTKMMVIDFCSELDLTNATHENIYRNGKKRLERGKSDVVQRLFSVQKTSKHSF